MKSSTRKDNQRRCVALKHGGSQESRRRIVCQPHRQIHWLLAGVITLALAKGASSQDQPQQYLIKLRDQPVAAYMAVRNGSAKGRANLESRDAVSYRSQLLVRQAAVRQRIEALPQAAVQAQMDTVFNGLAVTLRAEDVDAVKQFPEVEQVFPSIRYHKALDAALPLTHVPEGWTQLSGGEDNAGAGIRIAVIDSGVDINHPMLQDPSLTTPPGFPKFTAPTGPDPLHCPNSNFTSDQQFTNRKVIVARNYVSLLDNPDPHCNAEDRDGHGTFIAGIAAGRRVQASLGVSLVGVAPKAFLGNYKVFGTPGVNDDATEPAIVKAIDDAVKDGMDIINLSLGSPTNRPPTAEPLAVAVATAVDLGRTVVVAAGNVGPSTGTITSPGISPKAITVGSSTNSRMFTNPLTITASVPVPQEIATIAALPGNGLKIQSSLGPAPLVSVAALDSTGLACAPLPPGSLSGQIALIQRGCCLFSTKIPNAFQAGAIAAILYNHQANGSAFLMNVGDATQIPAAAIGNREGLSLEQLLATPGSGVKASLGAEPKRVATPANQTVGFSANGPSTDFGIKPDLVSPGTNLYSATQRNDTSGEHYDPSGFIFGSGTSFSTALVSGAAALVKQAAPAFITAQLMPAYIKSALVNTAARVVTTASGSPASVLTQGNGLLDLAAALATPVVVSPVSISFKANSPGSTLSSTTNLSITNVGPFADIFTITAPNSGPVTITASPSNNFALASGATTTVTINVISSTPLTGTVEGSLLIRSQNSPKAITIPYWGTFVRPTINPGGVVNAASFGPSGVVAGSLVSIFGKDLSSGGTTVTFTGVPAPAPILFASDKQINAQVPFELEGDTSAEVVVKVNGISSTPVTVFLASAAPGIFTVDRNGQGLGVIAHNSDFSPVTAGNPALPGEFLAVFATGLGAVFSERPAEFPVKTGIPAVTSPLWISEPQNTPSVTIGGIPAPVKFSGMAPCFLGLYQVNVEVPRVVPKGDQILVLTSNGRASNPVKLPVGEASLLAFGRTADSQGLPRGTGLCSAWPGLTFPDGTG